MHHRGKPAKNRRSVAASSADGAVLGVAPFNDLEQRYRSLVAEQGFRLGILQTIDGLMHGTIDPTTVSHAPASAVAHHRLRRRTLVFLSVVVTTLLLLIASAVYALQPKTVAYSFAQGSGCTDNLAVLPGLFSSSKANGFTITRQPTLAIGGVSIIAKNICVTPTAVPAANSQSKLAQRLAVGPIGLNKSITVVTTSYPAIAANAVDTKSTQPDQTLTYDLSNTDKTFSYALAYKDKTADCTQTGTQLSCPTQSLGLGYGSSYQVALQRSFGGKAAGTIMTTKLQTAMPVKITQSSLSDGTTLSAATQQITLTADRPLAAASNQKAMLSTKDAAGKSVDVPVKLSVSGAVLTIAYDQKLPQPATVTLSVVQLTATDKTSIAKPYTLNFKTAGGPVVVSSTLKSTGMAANQIVTVTFDQPLATSQNPVKLAVLKVNGVTQRAAYSLSGSTITLKPLTNYPACSTVTVQVGNDVLGVSGQSGSSAWTGTGKVSC